MNRAHFKYDDTDPQNTQQYAVREQLSNHNVDYNHNQIQEDSCSSENKNHPRPTMSNGDNRNSNKKPNQSHLNANNQYANILIINNRECCLNRLFTFGSYLISPIDEYRGKESAFTPLKNESLFLLSSSNKRDIQNSFEKCEFSLSKKEDGLIHGTCLNFNNIEISPEVSDNEEMYNSNKRQQQLEDNLMILSNNHSQSHSHNMNNNQSNNHSQGHNSQSKFNSNDNGNSVEKSQCTCTKTNCRKKYCACYANGKYCDNCQCKNCDNKGLNSKGLKSKSAMSIICNCTKSNCTKKYCECFKNGIECSSLCRCINCVNSSSYVINSNTTHQHQQEMSMNKEHSKQLAYSIEEIRIEIRDNVISVQQRGSHYCHSSIASNTNANAIAHGNGKAKHQLLNLNSNKRNGSILGLGGSNETCTPKKIIGKKRIRSKVESTNIKTPGLFSSNKNTRSHRKSSSNKKRLDL